MLAFPLPEAGAGSAFTRGWRSLPDELKVKILEYNLTLDRAIWCGNPLRTLHDMAGHFLGSREISDMAFEVFYGKNTFIIQISEVSNSFRYHQPPIARLMRSLEFHVSFEPKKWILLYQIADRQLGFENLQRVTVKFAGFPDFDMKMAMPEEKVSVDIKRLEVRVEAGKYLYRPGDVDFLRRQAHMVIDQVQIARVGKQQKVHEEWSPEPQDGLVPVRNYYIYKRARTHRR